MTVFPGAIDTDVELPRIDDNLSEVAGDAINALRSSVFSIEKELGTTPAGSAGSVSNRLSKSLTAAGDIKASALTSIGLATLPIVNNQVASNAGIKETKLPLDFSTADLNTAILASKSLLDTLAAFTAATNADLLGHIAGIAVLSYGSTPGRHVASHVDINAAPSDPRDPAFTWTGLIDKDGAPRTATNVASALLQINDALTTHENIQTVKSPGAPPASAIAVNTDNFTELPADATDVQKALDAIDASDRLQMGTHRAEMHANGIPRTARSQQLFLDGYSQNIVPPT